jgi:hypothetical protein
MTGRTTCSIRPAASGSPAPVAGSVAPVRRVRLCPRPRSTAASTSRYPTGSTHRRPDPARHHLRRRAATRSRRRGASTPAAAARCAATASSARPARSGVRRSDRRPQPRRIRARGADPLNAFGNFGIVPFLDAGNIYTSPLPELDDLRFGAGIGVRYHTRFGPIRVDVGTPLNPRAAIRGSPSTSRSARPSDGRGAPGAEAAAAEAPAAGQVRRRRWHRRLAKTVVGLAARPVPARRRLAWSCSTPVPATASSPTGSRPGAESGLRIRIGRIEGSIWGRPGCATSGSTIRRACSPNPRESISTGSRSAGSPTG